MRFRTTKEGMRFKDISYIYIVSNNPHSEYTLSSNSKNIRACKIGYDNFPYRRKNDYQVHTPIDLEMNFIQPVLESEVKFIESQIHSELQNKRIRGEWFEISSWDAEEVVKKILKERGYNIFKINKVEEHDQWTYVNSSNDSGQNLKYDFLILNNAHLHDSRYSKEKAVLFKIKDSISAKEILDLKDNDFDDVLVNIKTKYKIISRNHKLFKKYLTEEKTTGFNAKHGHGGFHIDNNYSKIYILNGQSRNGTPRIKEVFIKKKIHETMIFKNFVDVFLEVNNQLSDKKNYL